MQRGDGGPPPQRCLLLPAQAPGTSVEGLAGIYAVSRCARRSADSRQAWRTPGSPLSGPRMLWTRTRV